MTKHLGLMLAAALAAPAADPGLLGLAMPDARVVAGLNVAEIRKSPFGQLLLDRLSAREDEHFRRFIAGTGFDPRRDVEEIVVVATGADRNAGKLILARGWFDPPRFISYAVNHGARLTHYGGVDIIETRQSALAFLDSTTAVAGDPGSVRDAIDRRTGGSALDPDLTARIQALSAAQQVWFVSKIPVSELNLPRHQANPALGNVVNEVEGASGGAAFGNTADVKVEIISRTPQGAAELAGAARLLATLAQSARNPAAERLRPVWNSLDIKALENVVTIALMIPSEVIEPNAGILQPARR
ncbi:MAG TPA: hypothetical protein PLA43_09685 [Bryobacteraceae bacterium]|nr:hypothetical protein [Bryobacteraceae bacterium]HPU72218.1 hypothetical protein [Bryobacteraceae bacterium]